MAYDVHIHVCFACDKNDEIAALAKKYALDVTSDRDGCREARWFLDELSKRSGDNLGSKGGLSLWGMTGNYTNVSLFCETLRPFWEALLSGRREGPCEHEHIIVFEECEQTEAATAYEIGWADERGEWADQSPKYEAGNRLLIKKHERLPFSWMQF